MHQATKQVEYTNNKNIPFPNLTYIPLSSLEYEVKLNREEYTKLTQSMEDKTIINGFMDAIKVFPKNPITGKYKIAEATHRVRALRNIFQDDEDPMVPIAILWWKDGEDEDEVLSTVIEFNVTGKAWTIYDYVKARAGHTGYKPSVSKAFKELHSDMKKLKPRLSNSIVASIYTGESRVHTVIKDDKLAKNFDISSRRHYINTMTGRLDTLVIENGKKIVTNGFLRRYVDGLNSKINAYDDYSKWTAFFQRSITEAESGDESFKLWFNQI